jgi:uroporphyrinogen-III decarboxylase
MLEFVLDECVNDKSDRVVESQEILGMEPVDIYKDPEKIAELAVIIKEQRGQDFCMLPFCHTLEAEILGGNINLGDATAGARAGAPICESTSEVLNLTAKSECMERHDNMIRAIDILKSKGEDVMFCITGPIGTLTCLVESRTVFKEWRRNPEEFNSVLDHLSSIFIDLACEAAKAGASAIEYADPPSAVSIVGPKFASELCERFTMRFIRELSEKLGSSVPVYLCPLSATKDMKELEDVTVIAKCPKGIKGLATLD